MVEQTPTSVEQTKFSLLYIVEQNQTMVVEQNHTMPVEQTNVTPQQSANSKLHLFPSLPYDLTKLPLMLIQEEAYGNAPLCFVPLL